MLGRPADHAFEPGPAGIFRPLGMGIQGRAGGEREQGRRRGRMFRIFR